MLSPRGTHHCCRSVLQHADDIHVNVGAAGRWLKWWFPDSAQAFCSKLAKQVRISGGVPAREARRAGGATHPGRAHAPAQPGAVQGASRPNDYTSDICRNRRISATGSTFSNDTPNFS